MALVPDEIDDVGVARRAGPYSLISCQWSRDYSSNGTANVQGEALIYTSRIYPRNITTIFIANARAIASIGSLRRI